MVKLHFQMEVMPPYLPSSTFYTLTEILDTVPLLKLFFSIPPYPPPTPFHVISLYFPATVPDRGTFAQRPGHGSNKGITGGTLVDSFTGLLKFVWTGGLGGDEAKKSRQAKMNSSEIFIV